MRGRCFGLIVLWVITLFGCSKSSKPTAPPPATGFVVLQSSPEAASVNINGAGVSRFTPCILDTTVATYAIHLSMLGYADTTVSVAVHANLETLTVALRPIGSTPRTVTSWAVNAGVGMNVEGLALDPSQNVYVEAGHYGNAMLKSYTPTGTPISSVSFTRTDNLFSALVRDDAGNFYLAPYYGGYVSQLNASGVLTGQLGDPLAFSANLGGLARDASGESLFVANHSDKVTILRMPDGAVLRRIALTTRASGESPANARLARDAAGYLYLAVGPRDSLRKCNAEGYEVATWRLPRGAAALTVGPDGNLYIAMGPCDDVIAGHAPGLIAKFTTSGTLLSQWATEHILPSAIAMAANGDIYVTGFYGYVYRWTDH